MNETMTIESSAAGRPADHSAPLAGVTAGRLEFTRGASRVTIRTAAMDELFRAHFEGPVPEVTVDGGAIAIRYRQLSPAEWVRFGWLAGEHNADICLNASVAWELDLRGGLSRLDADLSGAQLTGFDCRGGVSNVELVLGEPRGIVPVRVRGGASHLAIWRPAQVPVGVSIRGGASHLELDDQRFTAIGGRTHVTTGQWRQATTGYDVDVAGGASHLSVGAR